MEDPGLNLGHRTKEYYKLGSLQMIILAMELLTAIGCIRMD